MLGRRRKQQPSERPTVDPASLPPAWARELESALEARARATTLVAEVRPGPTRDRLDELRLRLDGAVEAVGAIASRAAEIERVVATLDHEETVAALKAARRDGAEPELLQALEARFTSVQRLMNTAEDAAKQLHLLDAQLDAIVARIAEVALVGTGLDELDGDLAGVVDELDALRTALDAV